MTGIIHQHYLLDTVALIPILEHDPAFVNVLPVNVASSVPIIAIGELYAAAEHSARVQYNLHRFAQFANSKNVLLYDDQTAHEYGRVSQQLRKKGRPIPQNDMWIAALAIQHQLTLVTRDKHFNNIDGLLLKTW